jgi:rare lipoprotein A
VHVNRRLLTWFLPVIVATLGGCAARSTAPGGTPRGVLEVREGLASFYGEPFHGKTTASGVRFDMTAMVAAHPSYPFGTRVRVTNLANGRAVQVRIVDRGPAAAPRAAGVIIDVSRRAAESLRFVADGRTRVRLEVLRWGD